jgi:nickel-dependent lactate racemase
MTVVEIGTRAWYGDSRLHLTLPDSWEVAVHRPQLDPPLDDEQIRKIFAGPSGQRLAAMASGSRRPVLLVDDLTRPTPVNRVLPHVVDILGRGGDVEVTILIAVGSHAAPSADGIARKLGPLPVGSRVIVHDFRGASVRLGTTSSGTPVLVNPIVAEADLLVGMGGIYPHSSAGFSGGSKIVLGAMAERSLVHFHFGRLGSQGGYHLDNDFRRDLDEAAALARLAASVSVFVNDRREAVKLLVGPTAEYYAEAVEWARGAFSAPPPGPADVVISNAYPMDVSLTFMGSKGLTPLRHARPGASRVVVAGCPEGVGHHGLFPLLDRPRFYQQRQFLREMRARRSELTARRRELPAIALRRAMKVVRRQGGAVVPEAPHNPIALFVPEPSEGELPPEAWPGMVLHRTWDSVLAQVSQEQQREQLSAAVYACGPLHVIGTG